MYFELEATNAKSFRKALWEAEIMGLDPEEMDSLTFNIGTGSIEKVSRIRDKFNLTVIKESDYEPTGYLKG